MNASEPSATDRQEKSLKEYKSRRDFTKTSEPSGSVGSGGSRVRDEHSGETPSPSPTSDRRLAFVVQKHAASSLHYDFRLELDGVLKSWAVPKGPSLDPADKRLAVQTEDHPREYADFEGVIPEGEYGAGTVLVWDAGWWEPDPEWTKPGKDNAPTDPSAALASGAIKFLLHGHKLSGSWTLVQMKGRGDKNWLLIKHRDEHARPGSSVVDESPDSVTTGRALDEVTGA